MRNSDLQDPAGGDGLVKTYRKKHREDFWHFCSTCPQWPNLELMEVTAHSLAQEDLCPDYLKLQAKGGCE